MKTLVVYYSLSGNTQKVAEAIANRFEADVIRLEDRRSRTGLFGMLRTIYQTLFSRPGKIRNPRIDPYEYDLLILGSPIWLMKLIPPIRSYILKEKDRFNKVAFFCTEGSSGGSKVFKTMGILCDKQPIATLEMTEKDIKSDQCNQKIDTFIDTCHKNLTNDKAIIKS
jgi:flavodoxin